MKKYIKRFLLLALTLFILANVLIAIQAYGFTHFEDKIVSQEQVEESSFDKLKVIFTGIKIPRPRGKATPKNDYESITIVTDEEKLLDGWYIPTDSVKKGVVLVFHGYVDNKSSMLDVSEEMLKLGYDVVLIDFMGSGKSYGNQTTMGHLEAQNVYDTYKYVVDTMKEDNIFVYGFSMGAAAIMKAQHDYQMTLSGVMLQAPYATLKETVAARTHLLGLPENPTTTFFTFWMGAINGFDGFEANPIEYVTKITVPTLLMCGGKDPNIPNEETKAIFEAIGSSNKLMEIFEESAHESLLNHEAGKWRNIVSSFLLEIEKNHIHADYVEYTYEEE